MNQIGSLSLTEKYYSNTLCIDIVYECKFICESKSTYRDKKYYVYLYKRNIIYFELKSYVIIT